MMQSAGGRPVSFETLRSIYHHLFFEQKKLPANSTDSNKVAPKKNTKKNHYGIPRPTINFCLQNYRHSFMISAIINHTIKQNLKFILNGRVQVGLKSS